MRRVIGTALVATLALGLAAAPAEAKRGERRTVNIIGTLTGVLSDALMVDVEKANAPGRRYLNGNPGDAMVILADRTRFRGPMGLVSDAGDFRVGDGVRVKARLREGMLLARRLELRLHAFEARWRPSMGPRPPWPWTRPTGSATPISRRWETPPR